MFKNSQHTLIVEIGIEQFRFEYDLEESPTYNIALLLYARGQIRDC